MDHVTDRLGSEISSITSNQQTCFKKMSCNCWNEFEAPWEAIGTQELQKPIAQPIIHYGYPMMYLVKPYIRVNKASGFW